MTARSGVKKISPWLPGLVVALVAVFFVFFLLRSYEDDSANINFQSAAFERIDQLQDDLHEALTALSALGAYYDTSPEIDRNQFYRLTQPFLVQELPIHALEWVPRVAHSQRSRYVDAAQRSGYQGFDITEQNTQGEFGQIGQRTEYYPVYFVNPYVGNEKALGFDLGSNVVRRVALEAAMASGDMVATERINLVQETSDQYGILVFRPVYKGGILPPNRSERSTHLIGFALGVFRLGDLVEERGKNRMSPIQVFVFDDTAPKGSHLLYPKSMNIDKVEALPAGARFARKISVAGRTWTVICMPKSGTFVPGRYTSMAALEFGFLASLLWATYLKQKVSRFDTIEQVVVERTQQLNEERTFSSAIFNTIGGLILVIDRQGAIVRFNMAAEAFTGYSFEEVKGRPFFWRRFLLPEQRDSVEDVFQHFRLGTMPKEHENYWIGRAGQRRLFAWTNTTLNDLEGIPQFLVTMG